MHSRRSKLKHQGDVNGNQWLAYTTSAITILTSKRTQVYHFCHEICKLKNCLQVRVNNPQANTCYNEQQSMYWSTLACRRYNFLTSNCPWWHQTGVRGRIHDPHDPQSLISYLNTIPDTQIQQKLTTVNLHILEQKGNHETSSIRMSQHKYTQTHKMHLEWILSKEEQERRLKHNWEHVTSQARSTYTSARKQYLFFSSFCNFWYLSLLLLCKCNKYPLSAKKKQKRRNKKRRKKIYEHRSQFPHEPKQYWNSSWQELISILSNNILLLDHVNFQAFKSNDIT